MPTLIEAEGKDGAIVLSWPDGTPDTCIVSKYVLLEIVDQLNDLRAMKRAMRKEQQ
jgi:hypothetical protein